MGDWADPYLTMDFASEATIVAELLKFAASGQLYRGAKPVMWSPVEKTALAEAEVEYADIVSTQIDVAFEIVEAPNAPELVGALCRHLDDDPVDDPGQPGDRVWGRRLITSMPHPSATIASSSPMIRVARACRQLRHSQIADQVTSWGDLELAFSWARSDMRLAL